MFAIEIKNWAGKWSGNEERFYRQEEERSSPWKQVQGSTKGFVFPYLKERLKTHGFTREDCPLVLPKVLLSHPESQIGEFAPEVERDLVILKDAARHLRQKDDEGLRRIREGEIEADVRTALVKILSGLRSRAAHPETIGDFEIQEVLKDQSTGWYWSYRARTMDGEECILRLTNAPYMAGEEAKRGRERTLKREFETLKALREQTTRVPRIGEIRRHVGHQFIVPIYPLGGWSLSADIHRRDQHRSLPRVVKVARSCFDLLTQIHEAQVIHRALSPSSIHLLDEAKVGFTDFMVARRLEKATISPFAKQSSIQPSDYRPPECKRGIEHANQKSDVFSAAGSLVYWITDVEPGLFESEEELSEEISTNLKGDLPDRAVSVLWDALSEDPNDRPSAQQCLEVLKEAQVLIGAGTGHGAAPFRPGETVGGRYRLTQELSSSPRGATFLAEDADTQERVTLKLLSGELACHLVDRGIHVLRSLDHQGLPAFHDFDLLDGEGEDPVVLLAFKHVEGEALRTKLNDRQGDIELVRRIGEELASVIEHLAERDLIHRDISPGNIIIPSGPGPIKLIDLELTAVDAKSIGPAGTPAYMAPEIEHGGEHTVATELYSLATALFELLHGRLPYKTEDGELDKATPWEPGLELDEHADRVTQVLRKACSREAGDRYQSASAFRSALKKATAPVRVNVDYEDLRAEIVRNLTVESPRSTVFHIEGPSGIGKSTLLDTIYRKGRGRLPEAAEKSLDQRGVGEILQLSEKAEESHPAITLDLAEITGSNHAADIEPLVQVRKQSLDARLHVPLFDFAISLYAFQERLDPVSLLETSSPGDRTHLRGVQQIIEEPGEPRGERYRTHLENQDGLALHLRDEEVEGAVRDLDSLDSDSLRARLPDLLASELAAHMEKRSGPSRLLVLLDTCEKASPRVLSSITSFLRRLLGDEHGLAVLAGIDIPAPLRQLGAEPSTTRLEGITEASARTHLRDLELTQSRDLEQIIEGSRIENSRIHPTLLRLLSTTALASPTEEVAQGEADTDRITRALDAHLKGLQGNERSLLAGAAAFRSAFTTDEFLALAARLDLEPKQAIRIGERPLVETLIRGGEERHRVHDLLSDALQRNAPEALKEAHQALEAIWRERSEYMGDPAHKTAIRHRFVHDPNGALLEKIDVEEATEGIVYLPRPENLEVLRPALRLLSERPVLPILSEERPVSQPVVDPEQGEPESEAAWIERRSELTREIYEMITSGENAGGEVEDEEASQRASGRGSDRGRVFWEERDQAHEEWKKQVSEQAAELVKDHPTDLELWKILLYMARHEVPNSWGGDKDGRVFILKPDELVLYGEGDPDEDKSTTSVEFPSFMDVDDPVLLALRFPRASFRVTRDDENWLAELEPLLRKLERIADGSSERAAMAARLVARIRCRDYWVSQGSGEPIPGPDLNRPRDDQAVGNQPAEMEGSGLSQRYLWAWEEALFFYDKALEINREDRTARNWRVTNLAHWVGRYSVPPMDFMDPTIGGEFKGELLRIAEDPEHEQVVNTRLRWLITLADDLKVLLEGEDSIISLRDLNRWHLVNMDLYSLQRETVDLRGAVYTLDKYTDELIRFRDQAGEESQRWAELQGYLFSALLLSHRHQRDLGLPEAYATLSRATRTFERGVEIHGPTWATEHRVLYNGMSGPPPDLPLPVTALARAGQQAVEGGEEELAQRILSCSESVLDGLESPPTWVLVETAVLGLKIGRQLPSEPVVCDWITRLLNDAELPEAPGSGPEQILAWMYFTPWPESLQPLRNAAGALVQGDAIHEAIRFIDWIVEGIDDTTERALDAYSTVIGLSTQDPASVGEANAEEVQLDADPDAHRERARAILGTALDVGLAASELEIIKAQALGTAERFEPAGQVLDEARARLAGLNDWASEVNRSVSDRAFLPVRLWRVPDRGLFSDPFDAERVTLHDELDRVQRLFEGTDRSLPTA